MPKTLKPAAAQPTSKTAVAVMPASSAVMSPLDMPQALQTYLAQLDMADLLTPADEGRAWDVVARGMEMSAAGTIIAGHQLKRLRAELPAGRFSAGLAERGIARRTAYHAIEARDLFASMPEIDLVRAFAQVGINKALALGSLSTEQLSALAAGDEVDGLTLDLISEMSVRDLGAHIKDWKEQHDGALASASAEAARQRARADQAEIRLHTAEQALKYRDQHAAVPPWFKALKVEAGAVSETLDEALAGLEPLAQDNLLRAGLPKDQAAFREQAAGCMYHALAAVMLRGEALLARIGEAFPDVTNPTDTLWQYALEGDEMALASQRRAEVMRLVEFQRAQRQHERYAAGVDTGGKRGRGRPAGSKNKSKA